MRIFKFLFRILLALVLVFFIGGYFIPSQWSVSRSIVINTKASEIYPLISSFKEWDKWVPWNTSKDKTLRYTYEGPDSGVGAKQSWTSEKMGKGWMQFTQVNPQTGITYDLHIDMGHSQSNLQGTIQLQEENNATTVTWSDQGNSGNNFIKRWMSLLMKPMLDKEFKTGLEQLKVLAEKR